MSNPALARLQSKPKSVATKPAPRPTLVKTRTRSTRNVVPYARIKALYDAGKSMREISDTLKLTKSNTKAPYSIVNNALWKLGKGVTVEGKTLKIKRG